MSTPMTHAESRPADTGASHRRPIVWAVGGGKGGVGKSVVTSSLAITFARQGHRCALIDLDLGAANLHSLLGLAPPRLTLSHFLDRDVATLAEILTPTPFENLLLAGGARGSVDLANPKYSQKEKLLRHVRSLDFDHVFLDLSAGSAFNVLDFFLAAEARIAVLIPERTSVENTQHFLKAAFFRSLRGVAQREPIRSSIRRALAGGPVGSARGLVRAVSAIDPEAGRILAKRAEAFAPMLVVNRVEASGPRRAGSQIALACRHYLAASVRERGNLPRDERVRDAVSEGAHVLSLYPGSRFATAVTALAKELLEDAPPEPLDVLPAASETAARAAGLPPLDLAAPGSYLRGCREQLGLSLVELGRRTRIPSLASLEGERFDELPPESYVAAFVRDYARALGIAEGDRLARSYVERYRSAQRIAS